MDGQPIEVRKPEDLHLPLGPVQRVFNVIGQGVSITDAQSRFVYVNQAYAALLGYHVDDLIGKTPLDVTHPEDIPLLLQVRQQRQQNVGSSYEIRLLHVNGRSVHVAITSAPIWFDDAYRGSVAFITDLTARKQAERAQQRFARQLQTAADVARQINAILDPDQLLYAIVPLLQEQFALYHVHIYLLDEATQQLIMHVGSGEIGQKLRERHHAISIHEKHSLVARALRERQPILVQDVHQEPDFMANPLLPHTRSEVAIPLIAHKQTWGVLDVQDDKPASFDESDVQVLTVLAGQIAIALQNATLFAEQQKTEKKLAKMVHELEMRNADLEQFTYTVSHDLRSPLITIKGFLGLLEQDIARQNEALIRSDLARIYSAAQTMELLLGDLLQLSRAGRLVNEPEEVPFATLAAAATERAAGQLMAQGVVVTIEPDLPAVWVDRPRLIEVLQNLLENAAKFMGDQAQPHIVIGMKRDTQPPVFFVRDNGIGIEARYHERIFGLFERLNPDTEGTGLGLAFVKRVIELHNGRIWVESTGPGQGSTFCFTLPLSPQDTATKARRSPNSFTPNQSGDST